MATASKQTKAEFMQARAEHEARVKSFRDALWLLDREIEKWCQSRKWTITQSEKVIASQAFLPAYGMPQLDISTPFGELILKPVGYNVAGAMGRVDMYAYPSSYEVMLLLRDDSSWVVRTHSGIDWPHPWNEDTFVELTKALLRAE